MKGRSGTGPATPAKSTGDTPRSVRSGLVRANSSAFPMCRRQGGVEVVGQLLPARGGGVGESANHHIEVVRPLWNTLGDQVTQSALHPVAHHRDPDGFAHNETGPRPGGPTRVGFAGTPAGRAVVDPTRHVHHNCAASGAPPAFERGGEVGTVPNPGSRRQHRVSCRCRYAVRRARPRRRREATIARPARVRIRSRKPWVLARRRLFGWKVRLLTAGSPRSMIVVLARVAVHQASSLPMDNPAIVPVNLPDRYSAATRTARPGVGGRFGPRPSPILL